ncbi:MAG: hypothetical protein AAGD96_00395 [Chloroflexota bacterium]
MNGLEDEYAGSINFYRFDANEPLNQRLQNDLQLRGHPSVAIVTNQGEILNRYFGEQSAEDLRPVLDMLLTNNDS